MVNYGGFAGEKLRQLISQIEVLEEQKEKLAEEIRDVLAHAKGEGFDVKTIRQVLKIRKKDPEKFAEEEALLDTYLHALGLIPDSDSEREAA